MEKKDCYLGCIPKESIPQFFETLKKNIEESKKEGEVKEFSFEIRGKKEEPEGIAFETFTFGGEEYGKYVDDNQEYMKDALSVVTISLKAKDESSVQILQTLFEQFKPMIEEMPHIKKKAGKVTINWRKTTGNNIAIDIVTVDGKFIKPLNDMGINFLDYESFKSCLKIDFKPSDFFECNVDQIAEKVMSLVFGINSKTTNAKYLLTAFLKSLSTLQINDEKIKKKLEKILTYIQLTLAFVSGKILFEYSPKEILNGILQNAMKQLLQTENPDEYFSSIKMMAEQLGQQMIKPTLENMSLLEPVKALDIDEINFAWSSPKYKSGIAHVIRLPGFSKMFADKFLA